MHKMVSFWRWAHGKWTLQLNCKGHMSSYTPKLDFSVWNYFKQIGQEKFRKVIFMMYNLHTVFSFCRAILQDSDRSGDRKTLQSLWGQGNLLVGRREWQLQLQKISGWYPNFSLTPHRVFHYLFYCCSLLQLLLPGFELPDLLMAWSTLDFVIFSFLKHFIYFRDFV